MFIAKNKTKKVIFFSTELPYNTTLRLTNILSFTSHNFGLEIDGRTSILAYKWFVHKT